jgi:hypothetical protein
MQCGICATAHVEVIDSTSGAVDIGLCSGCGNLVIAPRERGKTLDDYAGTGLSLDALEKLPEHDADAILMRKLWETGIQLRMFKMLHDQAESLLRERILKRNGKRAENTEFVVNLKGTTNWTFELETLLELQNHVEPDDFDKAVVYVPPVPETRNPNKSRLNELAKRGGKVAEIIEKGCIPDGTSYKLEIVKKAAPR